jgi:hypothetical protein
VVHALVLATPLLPLLSGKDQLEAGVMLALRRAAEQLGGDNAFFS